MDNTELDHLTDQEKQQLEEDRVYYAVREQKAVINPDIGENSYHRNPLTWHGRVEQTFGQNLLDKLKARIPSGAILEVGSSAGLTTKELAHYFGDKVRVIGIDIDVDLLTEKSPKTHLFRNIRPLNLGVTQEKASEAKGTFFLQGDGYFPPLKEDSLEAIFAMNNIFHAVENGKISFEALKKTFLNWLKLLKPGGLICISGEVGGGAYIIFEVISKDEVKVFAEDKHLGEYEYNASIDVFHKLKLAFKELGLMEYKEESI
jgi:SAM-dependent methyltransferase